MILIVGLLLLPLLAPSLYWKRVASIAGIYALLALGFDFLAHFVGLVSLGGAFFIGVGGYTAAILNTSLGLPLVLTIPMATLGGGMICTLLLLPTLPLRGVYFAIVTLMYPLALMRIIEALNIFGGTDGILGVAGFPNRWVEQYLIIVIVIFALFGLRRLVNEDIGLVFRGVKDNDQAVRASGLSITFYKAIAVFIASGLGSLGGAYGFHEDPQVLHYGTPGTGLELVAGMTFTIEPMVNAGRRDVRLLPDGWTVVTRDHSLSSQWEHTVLVTADGFEVLTLGADERPPA